MSGIKWETATLKVAGATISTARIGPLRLEVVDERTAVFVEARLDVPFLSRLLMQRRAMGPDPRAEAEVWAREWAAAHREELVEYRDGAGSIRKGVDELLGESTALAGDFLQGILCAAADMAQYFDDGGSTEHLIRMVGKPTADDLRKAGTPEDVIESLAGALAFIHRDQVPTAADPESAHRPNGLGGTYCDNCTDRLQGADWEVERDGLHFCNDDCADTWEG